MEQQRVALATAAAQRGRTGAATAANPVPRLVSARPTAHTTANTHEASMTMFGPDNSVPSVAVDSMPMMAECRATAQKYSTFPARATRRRPRRMPKAAAALAAP